MARHCKKANNVTNSSMVPMTRLEKRIESAPQNSPHMTGQGLYYIKPGSQNRKK